MQGQNSDPDGDGPGGRVLGVTAKFNEVDGKTGEIEFFKVWWPGLRFSLLSVTANALAE